MTPAIVVEQLNKYFNVATQRMTLRRLRAHLHCRDIGLHGGGGGGRFTESSRIEGIRSNFQKVYTN